MLRDLAGSLHDSAIDSCEGKSSASIGARAGLLAYLAYAGVMAVEDPLYNSWFAGLTLVIHEAGHLVCRGLGDTMYVLGGSLLQLLVPAFVAAYLLLFQRDWFGFAVGLAWLGLSGWNLATYVADASRQDLPLASLSPSVPEHDWAKLLTQWHLLNDCDAIASGVRVFAFAAWAMAMALGVWVLVTMARNRA